MHISGALHLKLSEAADNEDLLKKCLIGYQTIVTSTNVTASTEAAGFPATSLANPLTAERWKPTALPAIINVDAGEAQDVDYIGLASHTFALNGNVITMQYSTDGVTYELLGELSPGDGKPLMLVFDTVTARYFRITITGDSVPSLGVLYIGKLLVMQRGIYGGHTPITMGRKTKVIRNKTEGGQFAGISIITEGVQTSFAWKNLEADWYRENFEPFAVAARQQPFFIAWRYFEFPYEVGYCWTTQDIRPTNMGVRNLMEVSMDVEGYSDD